MIAARLVQTKVGDNQHTLVDGIPLTTRDAAADHKRVEI